MRCLIDMDGVVVDLLTGWVKHRGLALPDPYPNGVMNWLEIFNILPQDIWVDCDAKFWAELPPIKIGLSLLFEAERIFGAKNVFLVTSVVSHASAAEGKINWIAKNCPRFLDRYIITPKKDILSHSGVVLVDDDPKYLPDFAERGGNTILYPAPWNYRYNDALRSLEITLGQLAFLARAEREYNIW